MKQRLWIATFRHEQKLHRYWLFYGTEQKAERTFYEIYNSIYSSVYPLETEVELFDYTKIDGRSILKQFRLVRHLGIAVGYNKDDEIIDFYPKDEIIQLV